MMLTDAQVKHLVDRFLGWRLPEHFRPDGGISFKEYANEHFPEHKYRHEPTGTNLLDAQQAEAMVRHMLEGMPGEETALSALHRVMRQAETDLKAAHAEIAKLQGLDPAAVTWPEWSSPANTLRWFVELRTLHPLPAAPAAKP